MRTAKTLIGNKYGRLTVISKAAPKNNHATWRCRCDCGNIIDIPGDKLKYGHTKSCGCLRQEIKRLPGDKTKTHGAAKTRLYRIWAGIITRCTNPNNGKTKKDYQDRGIMACSERRDFSVFQKWALANGYAGNLTIDRVDNDKGYFPDNCRWATIKQQDNNKRNNQKVMYNNVTHTIAEWAEFFTIKYGTLYYRIVIAEWNAEKAFTEPVRRVA